MGKVDDPASPNDSFELPRRIVAFILLGAAASTIVITLPYLAGGAPHGDDHSSHLAEIVTIARVIQAGETDFWFDQTLLGYPLFMSYQPLPSLVMGGIVALTDWLMSPVFVLKLSIVLLWAVMPMAWYRGGRWLGLDRTTALLFGMLILVVSDHWNFGLGLNSTARYGLYTQVWAAALFPLTLGSLYRYAFDPKQSALAPVTLLSATLLSHVIAGYLCCVASVLLLLLRREGTGRRLARLAIVWVVTPILTGFWLVPFILNLPYQGGFPWKWESTDGYPVVEALFRLVRGDVLDGPRFPWVTILAGLGILSLPWTWRDRPTRWIAAFGLLSILFWLGPINWSELYRKLPFHGEMQVLRYIAGIQLAGLFLAAVGVRSVLGLLHRVMTRQRPGGARLVHGTVATFTAVLLLIWLGTVHVWFATFDPEEKDYAELADVLSRESGRFAIMEDRETMDHFHTNLLPLLAGRPHLRSFGRGYHDTLSMYYMDRRTLTPSDYRLYDVHHLVGSSELRVSSSVARPLWENPSYRVYEVTPRPELFEFVHTPLTVYADRPKDFRRVLREITLPLFDLNMLPMVDVIGPPAGDRIERLGPNSYRLVLDGKTVLDQASRSRLRNELTVRFEKVRPVHSRVTDRRSGMNRYAATVVSEGGGEKLLLKTSYHPGWKAAVDGTPVDELHVAPNLMAIEIPAGEHEVEFRYRNPRYQKIGFVLSLVGWLAWLFVPSLLARRKTPPSSGPERP